MYNLILCCLIPPLNIQFLVTDFSFLQKEFLSIKTALWFPSPPPPPLRLSLFPAVTPFQTWSRWQHPTWRSASRSTRERTRVCSAGRSGISCWRTGCATEARFLQVRLHLVSCTSFFPTYYEPTLQHHCRTSRWIQHVFIPLSYW